MTTPTKPREFWILDNGDGGQYSLHLNENEAITIASHHPRLEITHVIEVLPSPPIDEDIEKKIQEEFDRWNERSFSGTPNKWPTKEESAEYWVNLGLLFGLSEGVRLCLEELRSANFEWPIPVADWLEQRMKAKGVLK